jgi:hypothetical protein
MTRPRKKSKDWPHWSHRTKREWKADVRRRAAEADRALARLNFGSAFTPAGLAIDAALKQVQQIRQLLSEKEWGR